MDKMKKFLYHDDLNIDQAEVVCAGMITRLYSRNRSAGKWGKLNRTDFVICEGCGALFYKPKSAGVYVEILKNGECFNQRSEGAKE